VGDGGKAEVEREIDPSEDAAKMRKAVRAREKFMRHAGQADEFNLG
jgi:ATP-dependent RNA helicase DDX31/DBP7